MPSDARERPFVHLHVHSSYSLGEALSTPGELCAFAKLAGFESLAITDTNSTAGFMEFHRETRKLGIKPIYGATLLHAPLALEGPDPFRIILLAVSREGLRNLVALAGLAGSRFDRSPDLSVHDLESHSNGLVALAGMDGSEIWAAMAGERGGAARDAAGTLKEIFRENFFIELHDVSDQPERAPVGGLMELAGEMGAGTVFTQDVRYAGREKREVFSLLSEVFSTHEREDFFAPSEESGEKGMRSLHELSRYREVYGKAYDATLLIDEMVPGDLLDEFTRADETGLVDRSEEAAKILRDKLLRRFNLYFHNVERIERRRMKKILEDEMDLIEASGLSYTFLLFHDIISALRQERVRKGPATGLSVQSLCAFLLNITAFNPYGYGDFKPVFNGSGPENRIFEIQIASEDREVAVAALRHVCERQHMAYVPGVERLTPLRALKAVAARHSIEEGELEIIIKKAMERQGVSLKKLCSENEPLGSLFKKSANARSLITKASMLEGLPTGFIKAKRSLILSPRPVRDFLGVFMDRKGGDLFVQATRDSFPVGAIYRIDLTPLSSLSVCLRTERELRKQRRRVYDWDELPREDAEVWKDIQRGETMGVYLMERSNVKKQCAVFGPSSIEDLTDFLALMRLRVDDKNFAEKVEEYKAHNLNDCDYKPELMAILGRMRGMILYEEQLRDILAVLTGVDAGEANDMLRRFREEDPGVLSTLRREFMRRSANHDVPMNEANRWFEKIRFYVGRTVGHQRTLADALLVFKMSHLKRHHPSIYFLALLNTYWDNDAKLRSYLAYLHDLDLLLPVDINRSELYFTLEGEKIRLGLQMVEGVSYAALLHVLNARAKKKSFKSLEDFIRKTKGRGIGLETIGRLIVLGAFDFTGISRTNMINALPELYENPAGEAGSRLKDQLELPFKATPSHPRTGGDLMELLINEKLGTGGKGEGREEYVVLSALEEFYSQRTGSLIEIAGQVSNVQRFKTKSGRLVGFFVLFDFSAFVHVFIPWARFSQVDAELEEGKKVVVRGRVNVRDEKRICEALDIRSFGEGAAGDGEKGPDEPAERNP